MRTLRWVHRGWLARRWDLMEGDRVVATLEQRGWGFNADLRMGERSWKLVMTGFLRWGIEVRDDVGVVASMKMGWRGNGEPTFADGRRFRWDTENWWGTRWGLDEPERGARVASVHMERFMRLDARVEVDDPAMPDEALVPLLALAWLSLVISMQAATTAGAG